MTSKLVKFILPIAALASLIMSSLPASAQTSGMGMQNQSRRGSTMNRNRGGANMPSQSTTPSSQSPSNSIKNNSNRNLSSYSPQNAPLLKIGSRGQAVKDIQAFLEKQKLYNGPTDGVYGLKTRSAVMSFQRSRKLTVDGVLGQKTWSSMINSPVS